MPVAATVNVATDPALTDWFAGCAVKTGSVGASLTVSTAVELVTLPPALPTTTR